MGAAYCVIGWLLAQVAEFAFENFGAPDWVLKTFVVVLLLGLPLALLFAWAFELTPDGIKLEKNVAPDKSVTPRTGRRLDNLTLAAAALVIVILVVDRLPGPEEAPAPADSPSTIPAADVLTDVAPDRSIAVLPFVAMTASQDDEFFADGLSEELLNVLTSARTAIRLRSRTRSPTAWRALQAEILGDISQRESKDEFSVTAQNIYLIASELLSEKAVEASPSRRLVRVAAHAVAGDVPSAIAKLDHIDVDNSVIMISPIALPVDELLVFEALYEEQLFQQYATRERYRVAAQARMRASGETRKEIMAEVEEAGYELSH